MRVQNKSERRIGMNVSGKGQIFLEIGSNDVPDADWKAGKADIAAYIEAGDVVEGAAKAAAPEPQAESDKGAKK